MERKGIPMNISTSTIAKKNEKKTMVLSDLYVIVCVRVQELTIKKNSIYRVV